jgi:hypothetical protein
MALADTIRAIGAVSSALKERIDAISTVTTFVGRPSDTSRTNPHLNLFLYEIGFDPSLKNTALNEGEKPPLWIVLKYLLTAFESATDSDSENAHFHLGAALRAVYTDDLLELDGLSPTIIQALSPNPSPLHVTFDESPSDLLAKLMQGPDDKVRLSACFQVRPVMIAAAEPGDFSLLVGVDYTKLPVTLAAPYVGLDVIPSLGAHIDDISPVGFELGEEVTLRGKDMHLSGLSVMLGPVELPVTMQQPDELRFAIDPAIIAASTISAGSHPVTVVRTLTGTGKKRKSNAVIGNLVPTLSTAAAAGAVTVVAGLPRTAFATIDLRGVLLGLDADDTVLAFFRDGTVHKMFDVFTVPPALPALPGSPAPPVGRRLVMASGDAVPAGDYNMILIVNGQQAPQSPPVHLDNP